MIEKRDYQRSRVYAWENKVVAPRDTSTVSFAAAQAAVNAIWADRGLCYPPGIERLPAQAKATIASATRLSIFLSAQTPSWCLLHEIAHAMTSTADGRSDGHGSIFMGIYVQLITRYLRLDIAHLIETLQVDGIEIALDARPVFLDQQ